MTHSDSGSDGGFARRTILQAAGLSGVAGLAGCLSEAATTATTGDGADAAETDDGEPALPETGSPEVVDLDGRGREVTLRSVHARHAAHPESSLGGPVEMPVTWAFQADDGTPSVPGPVL
ncbi:membrane protein Pan1 [Halorubrum californiense DSM 19288]|uniref:Membrane protein Pan1 n=1 Tax=Halorubrum californiense DSM 19288 TaxID=1227465 RepID=M0EBL8_9EURY|nr:membrane protein Pan1 [Halorubrum californiense DSM 19288]